MTPKKVGFTILKSAIRFLFAVFIYFFGEFMSLTPVISVIKEKCVNCHRCIAVCPVKFWNDGSGNYVSIHHDLCIGCGKCERSCPAGSISVVDRVGV